MEVDDIQTPQPSSKYSRVGSNGRLESSKIGLDVGSYPDTKTESFVTHPTADHSNATMTPAQIGGDAVLGGNRLQQWQHPSRIIRVSRASGGKDRHSKVWTAKGARDRRVRLSVSTAIQFYDLQDRLGFDQPSKAVEWLIKAASEAINELPSLNNSNFPPETPRQLSDERCGGNVVDSGEIELDGDPGSGLGQNQIGSVSRSGCSSNNSETSKGSGLSLSRSEIRVKARERARERTAMEKDKDGEPQTQTQTQTHTQTHTQTQTQTQTRTQSQTGKVNVNLSHQHQRQQNVSSIGPAPSFTQLLTGGISNLNESHHSSSPPRGSNQWLSTTSSTPMDYFGGPTGLMGPSSSRGSQSGSTYPTNPFHISGVPLAQVMAISPFSDSHNHHQSTEVHPQRFPFGAAEQHFLQAAGGGGGGCGGGSGGGGGDHTLNFSISTSSATSVGAQLGSGFSNNNNNRGTLQSNSPSMFPYLQRFSTTDGSSLPFFPGGAAVENHHNHHHNNHQQQFQLPGLQLYYSDGGRQSDQKGKGKNS